MHRHPDGVLETPAAAAFAPLGDAEIVLLTTFRPTGEAVATPVGIAFADGKAYFMTLPSSGKVGRIASDARVTIAACTRGGAPRGPAVAGTARRLEGVEAERARAVMATSFYGRLWLVLSRSSREQPVICEVWPSDDRRGPDHRTASFKADRPPADRQGIAGAPDSPI